MGAGFQEAVWRLAAKIPRGRVGTYRGVAKALGEPRAARAVGNALNRSPGMRGCAGKRGHGRSRRKVPCHRVVRSNGSIGGYAKGAKRKEAMLRADGIEIKNGRILGLERYLFKFGKR